MTGTACAPPPSRPPRRVEPIRPKPTPNFRPTQNVWLIELASHPQPVQTTGTGCLTAVTGPACSPSVLTRLYFSVSKTWIRPSRDALARNPCGTEQCGIV
eukprot:330502-Chlamydomonas_euryale.AAC.1